MIDQSGREAPPNGYLTTEQLAKGLNGPPEEAVFSTQALAEGQDGRFGAREFSLTRAELIAVVDQVRSDPELVRQMADYAKYAADEVAAGKLAASQPYPFIGAILEKFKVDDPQRKAVCAAYVVAFVSSYIAREIAEI